MEYFPLGDLRQLLLSLSRKDEQTPQIAYPGTIASQDQGGGIYFPLLLAFVMDITAGFSFF
jgi:hypothetical protein